MGECAPFADTLEDSVEPYFIQVLFVCRPVTELQHPRSTLSVVRIFPGRHNVGLEQVVVALVHQLGRAHEVVEQPVVMRREGAVLLVRRAPREYTAEYVF